MTIAEQLVTVSNNSATQSVNSQMIAENQQKVFDAGLKAVNAGVQWNGARTNYTYGYYRWIPKQSFYPQYNIFVDNGEMGFARWNAHAGTNPPQELYLDMAERLQECGVVLDTSQATTLRRMFQYSYGLTHVPPINAVNSTNNEGIFDSCRQLVTVDKLIFSENGSGNINNCFYLCVSLVNLVIEGVIDSDCDMKDCLVLSKASFISVITHLSDTTSGKTATFSATAVNTAFETSTGANDGSTSAEWQALISTKSNWNISLV